MLQFLMSLVIFTGVVFAQSKDAEIKGVLDKVISRTEAFRSAEVQVENGIVYITGGMPNPKAAQSFQEISAKLPGVVTVVDQSEVGVSSLKTFEPFWAELHSMANRLKLWLPSLLVAIAFLSLFYFSSGFLLGLLDRLWGRQVSNPFLLSIITRLTAAGIWLFILAFVIRILGLSTLGATIIGGTGILGIIVGLSFKGITENYLAGLLLAARSPFTKGDLIVIGSYKGYVQSLNMRGTTIIDFNGNLILIPNIMVISSVVENQTANPKTRTSFTLGLGYQDSIVQAQEIIIEAARKIEGVLADPAPSVIVKELNSSSVQLSVRVWFDVREHRENRIRSRVMIKAKETLLAAGFDMPSETRELMFAGPLKVEQVSEGSNFQAVAQERKQAAKVKAASNLREVESTHAAHDPSSEEMLAQAEKNPLPNSESSNLLKK